MLRRTTFIEPSSNLALQRFMFPLLLGILLLIGYISSLPVGFHSDDFVILSQIQQTRFGPSFFAVEPQWMFYRPLGKLLWFITYIIWGYSALPYRLVSLALHWIMSLLVVAFVRRLYPTPSLIAPGAGILFALLPLHVESVVWLASQYDLLASVLYVATLLCLLIAWQRSHVWLYGLSLIFYQLCLWSKELAFTLPLLVVIVGMALPQRPRLRTILLSAVPYAVLVGINILQRLIVWGNIGGYTNVSQNYLAFVWNNLSATLAVLIAPLNQLIFPAPVVQLWLLAGAAIVLAGLMAARNQRQILFGLAWLGATLVPVLNILPVTVDLQSSRFLYLPSVGFCVGLIALLDASTRTFAARYRQPCMYGSMGLLSAAYTLVLWAHIQPWRIAGREATHTIQELHRFVPVFALNSTLQVAGLPDNYKGAYIYRLGLDTAHHQQYGSLFRLEQFPQLPPLSYTNNGDLFQVAFGFDETTTRWEITTARGITTAAAPISADVRARWDFTACTEAAGWQGTSGPPRCDNGDGVYIQPFMSEPSLISPTLTPTSVGWTEVIIDMARTESSDDAVLDLFWTTKANTAWNDDRRVTINLPPNGTMYRYHLFLPPDTTREPIHQLRLDPINTQDDIVLKQIAIRPIP